MISTQPTGCYKCCRRPWVTVATSLLLLAALTPLALGEDAGGGSSLRAFLRHQSDQFKVQQQGELPYVPYLILMETGSVGSSWLTHVLNSHPNIVSHGEQTTQILGLQSVLTNAKARGEGVQAVGVKVKRDRLRGSSPLGKFYNEKGKEAYGHHPDTIPALLKMLNRTNAKLICLYRRNFVKHAVSQVRHHQQARIGCGWETTKDTCVQKLATLPLSDLDSLARYTELLEMDVNDTLSICAQYAEMTSGRGAAEEEEDYARAYAYEDLVYGSDATETFEGLQKFLHVSPIDIVGHYNTLQRTIKKITPKDLSSYLVNYAEVDEFVKSRYGEESKEYVLFSSKAD